MHFQHITFDAFHKRKEKNLPGTYCVVHIHMLHIFIMEILGQSAGVSCKHALLDKLPPLMKMQFKFCVRRALDLDIE